MDSMQPPAPKRRPMAEINVVPYIDVMLVLLIIFMVTAPMLVQSVQVDLPQVESAPTEIEPDDNTLIIAVDQNGTLFLEREDAEPSEMDVSGLVDYIGKVKQQVPSTRVMIRGDARVPYGRVVALMGGLQNAGLTNVGLITEAPDPEAQGNG